MGWATPKQAEPTPGPVSKGPKLAPTRHATDPGAKKSTPNRAPKDPKPPAKGRGKPESGPKQPPEEQKSKGDIPPNTDQSANLPNGQSNGEPSGQAAAPSPDPFILVPESGYPDAEPNRGGRPTDFTQEKLEAICGRLAKGEPLACICRSEGMPVPDTVRQWMLRIEGVSSAIACARETGFDVIAHDAMVIADTPCEGIRTKITAEGPEVWKEDMLGHRRLQVETRLKLLAKWCPKRYGDKLELSGNPDQPGQAAAPSGGEITPEFLADIRVRRKRALEGRPRIGEKQADAREVDA